MPCPVARTACNNAPLTPLDFPSPPPTPGALLLLQQGRCAFGANRKPQTTALQYDPDDMTGFPFKVWGSGGKAAF